MKKILYTLLAGAMALSSCSKSDDMPTAPQSESTTFTLAVDAAETRATSPVTPARYIMEVWSEDGTTAENVFENNTTNYAETTSGSAFTVTLDKTKAYTCLFWADFDTDNTTGAFNAASLKAISLNAGKEVTEAYFSKVAVARGKNPSVAVTLKRAVAKITLTETATVKTTDDIILKLSNIYRTFSVQDAQASGTATEWTKTIKPAATTGTIATFYFFAKTDKELSDLKFTYAPAAENTVSNIPVQQNFATNIKGEYSKGSSFTFTIMSDDEWLTPDNEVDFSEKLKVGSFYYGNNTFSNTYDNTRTCIGIVFVVNEDGKTGKIVSLDQADKVVWSTETINTGATSDTDGAANTAKIFALSSYSATVYPAFALVKSQNDANTVAGIKWYLPAKNELSALYGTNGETWNIVNRSLNAANETPLSTSSYWSSTEGSGNSACQVSFLFGYAENYYKNTNNDYVRVVSTF